MELIEDRRFYVYALLDTRKSGKYIYGKYEFEYEPFYIGKGHKNRLNKHFKNDHKRRNPLKHNIIDKIIKETGNNPLVIKIEEYLIESESFDIEINLIKLIGRRDLKLGSLSNMTDGGEGSSGKIVSEETRKKKRGRIPHNKGISFSEDIKEKMRVAKLGKKRSKETHKKIMNIIQKYLYEVTDPIGNKYIVRNLKKFSESNNLNTGHIYDIVNNKRKMHRGWTVIRTHEMIPGTNIFKSILK